MKYLNYVLLSIVLFANSIMGMDSAKQQIAFNQTPKSGLITHIFVAPLPKGIERTALHLPGVQTIESDRKGGFFALKTPIDSTQEYAKYRSGYPHFNTLRDRHNCREKCNLHDHPMFNGNMLGVVTNYDGTSEESEIIQAEETFEGKLFLMSTSDSSKYQAPYVKEITSPILHIRLVRKISDQRNDLFVDAITTVLNITPAS